MVVAVVNAGSIGYSTGTVFGDFRSTYLSVDMHLRMPLYWAPQVACSVYSVSLCIQYHLYIVVSFSPN